MKRVLAILLCLMLILSVTACKPDNITYPVDITDPNDQAGENVQENDPDEEQKNDPPAADQNPAEGETVEPSEEQTEETPDDTKTEETPEEAKTEETAEDAKPEETPEEPAVTNPLAAKDFVPSATTAGTLQASGIVKQGAAVSALKNRTITFYTADNRAAFYYTDKREKVVSEWDWMRTLAEENGFIVKYEVKSSTVSIKSQRVALFAGKKLSLVQMTAAELGNGMTLAAAADALLNLDTPTYGISKAVLQQSGNKLFAPVGNIDTLWYDPNALPEGYDLKTTVQENKWTVEQFKTLCEGSQANLRLEMNDLLPWTTLSGRSPLTLLEGKLDSNLYAKVTRDAWDSLKSVDFAALRTPKTATDAAPNGASLFLYTNDPTNDHTRALQYAPLPALEEGTAGTVTFAGTFFALPKYETDTEAQRAALAFAELWCNRYTEARAAILQKLGIEGADYQAYCDLAETHGMLILYTPEIQKAAEGYLAGLTDPAVDMDAAYEEVKATVEGLIAARNLYY